MNLTVANGAVPVVCESFCNDHLTPMHYPFLKETNRRLGKLGVPILPVLAACDDGAGHWKEGFGARSITQGFYKIDTANYKLLENLYV